MPGEGGQQWDSPTFGDTAGAVCVPWGMAQGPCRPQAPPRQDDSRKTWSFQGGGSCAQPELGPPAGTGLEQRAHSHPGMASRPPQSPSRGPVAFPRRQMQPGFGTPCSMGAQHAQQPPYCFRGGCSAFSQRNPARLSPAGWQQSPAWPVGQAGPRSAQGKRHCSEPSCLCRSHSSLTHSPGPPPGQRLPRGAAAGAMAN